MLNLERFPTLKHRYTFKPINLLFLVTLLGGGTMVGPDFLGSRSPNQNRGK